MGDDSNKLDELETRINKEQVLSALQIIKDTVLAQSQANEQADFYRLDNIFFNFTGASSPIYKPNFSGNYIVKTMQFHTSETTQINFDGSRTFTVPAGFYSMTHLDIPLVNTAGIQFLLSASGSISGIISVRKVI
jgi:hypothetical protein